MSKEKLPDWKAHSAKLGKIVSHSSLNTEYCEHGKKCYRRDLEHVLLAHGGHCPAPPKDNPNIVVGYHQTSNEVAAAIVHDQIGFRCGSMGMFGGGIYFAHSLEDTRGKARSHGSVFACIVDIGKPKIVYSAIPDTTIASLRKEGFDSISARPALGKLSRPEFVVYEPKRVLQFVCLGGTDKDEEDAFVGEWIKEKFPSSKQALNTMFQAFEADRSRRKAEGVKPGRCPTCFADEPYHEMDCGD